MRKFINFCLLAVVAALLPAAIHAQNNPIETDANLKDTTTRLWYVAETGSPAWPATSPQDQIYVTRNLAALLKQGWYETGRSFSGDHVKIVELKFRSGELPD